MTPNFFQAANLKKIWVEATIKKSQVAPYTNLSRCYRVLFNSLLRVQIKRASVTVPYQSIKIGASIWIGDMAQPNILVPL